MEGKDTNGNKMKIFGIGLSRTGTTSLAEALSILGIPSVHFVPELFINQEKISPSLAFRSAIPLNLYWSRLREAEIKILRKRGIDNLFNFQSFSDLPIPLLYKVLDEKFPESKFIYTYRNIDKWLHSMKWLLTDGQVLWQSGFVNEEIRLAMYGTRFYNEEKLREAYWKHHNDIKEYFKFRPQDILSINIDEQRIDFDTLCSFLSLKMPCRDFPIVNQPVAVSLWDRVDYKLTKNNIPYSIGKRLFNRIIK